MPKIKKPNTKILEITNELIIICGDCGKMLVMIEHELKGDGRIALTVAPCEKCAKGGE